MLVTLATPGFAENRQGSTNLSPYVGGYVLDKEQHEESRPVFGLRAGYNFTKHLGAEAVFDYSLTETRRSFGSRETDRYRYGIDILYHFMPDNNFVPFIAVGGGGTNFNIPNTPSAESHYAGLVNYGVGLKYFVAPDVALRADVRHAVLVHDLGSNNLEYAVGLTFQFGGERKPVPVAVVPKCEPVPVVTPAPAPQPEAKVEEKVIILASEPQVEEKVLVAAVEPKIIVLAFEDIHFEFDQSTLTPEAKTILKRNVLLLKENPNAQIRIAGYTSASGTEEYNQKLSERRADAVKAYLVNEGVITSGRLSTIGYGETNPAVHEAAPKDLYSPAAKANIRVLFEVIVQ